MDTERSVFWDDLAQDLKDPQRRGPSTRTLNHPVISPFIASQYPPSANLFGGAAATWARTALIVASFG